MSTAEYLTSGLLVFAFLPTFGQAKSDPPQPVSLALIVKQSLSQAANGVDGELELWQDSRVTPKFSQQMWGKGGLDVDDDPTLAIFKKEPPRNAELHLVDNDGKVLQRELLERPLARLEATHLYGDRRISYELTVDYSAGFGSYSGPITAFVEVQNAHMNWVEATGIDGKRERLTLMQSLKTAWRQVSGPGRKGVQFLEAACRPEDSGSSEPKFQITYKRYFFDGNHWRFLARTVNGFTEFEEGFPLRKQFP